MKRKIKRVKGAGLVPSWTGAGTESLAGNGRAHVQRWLEAADTKAAPVYERRFTENINWRIFRIMAEFIEGFEFLSSLKKEVSFFGSTRVTAGNRYYKMAKALATKCGKAGFSIVTGGGPGIMEAANWGGMDAGVESVGLNISLPTEQRQNQYVRKSMGFHYFFTRKVMLSASAQAYVFFPGGFGTLDELFEIITLIQTGKMSDQVPVILMGREYWEPLLKWLEKSAWGEHRFVDKEDLKIPRLVDSVDQAFAIIKKTKERRL